MAFIGEVRVIMQDVWSELGAPSSTAAKSADSMLMHMSSGNPPGADYFYTYHNRSAAFHFPHLMPGFDFCDVHATYTILSYP